MPSFEIHLPTLPLNHRNPYPTLQLGELQGGGVSPGDSFATDNSPGKIVATLEIPSSMCHMPERLAERSLTGKKKGVPLHSFPKKARGHTMCWRWAVGG